MTKKELLTVEANMMAYNGKHTIRNGVRLMEYKGVTFVWDPAVELWTLPIEE